MSDRIRVRKFYLNLKLFSIVLLILLTSSWTWPIGSIPKIPGSSSANWSAFDYTIFWESRDSRIVARNSTGAIVFTGSDIGKMINTLIFNLPTVKNQITNRFVPDGSILIDNKPGVYNGSTTITLYDDWYVVLGGQSPSSLSIENPDTIDAQAIDIESAQGVIQLLHNPIENLGGGTIQIRNLDFETSTAITAPLNGVKAVVAIGSPVTNPARVLLDHVGARDNSGSNELFNLQSGGGDDSYQVNDLFGYGTTFHSLVFVQVNHFTGEWLSLTSVDSTNPANDGTMLHVIPMANFLWRDVHLFGIMNSWLWVQYSGANPHIAAYFEDFFTELTRPTNSPGIQGIWRASFENPTVFDRFTWGASYNSLNDTGNIGMPYGGYYVVQVRNSVQYNGLGKLPFPFGAGSMNSAGTIYPIGVLMGNNATPTPNRTYTVVGADIYNFTSTGGTAVMLTIEDPNGSCLVCGASTTKGDYLAIGDTVNFGEFSAAPTTYAYSI